MRQVNLIEYLPDVLRDVREFKEITSTENVEMNTLWKSIQDVFDDQFIMQSTVNGVRRWEKILGIYPKADDTLEIRKFRILAMLNKYLPYTHRSLEQMLNAMFGIGNFDIVFNYNEYELSIEFKVMPIDPKVYSDTMREVIPCNLTLMNYFKMPSVDIELSATFTHWKVFYPITNRFKCAWIRGRKFDVNVNSTAENVNVKLPYPVTDMFETEKIKGKAFESNFISNTENLNIKLPRRICGKMKAGV